MTFQTQRACTSSPHREAPTLGSIWFSVSGCPITDEVLDWPPDLFALTETILCRSEVYRFVLSPPAGATWPPRRIAAWSDAVRAAARQWTIWVEQGEAVLPNLLADEWRVIREQADMPLEQLAGGHDWRTCEALLTAHAIADEACAGVGVPLGRPGGHACLYRARGRELLARKGTLARIHPQLLCVLPKIRTSPNRTSLNSFSRYACVYRPGVKTLWHKLPTRHRGTDLRAAHSNLLLLPWPLRVRESDFRAVEGSVQTLSRQLIGCFEFAPKEKLDLDLVSRMIVAGQDEVDSVDVVVLPESAIGESEIDDLEAILERHGVTMLITGVRSSKPGRPPGNWVHIGTSPRIQVGEQAPTSSGERWFHVRQNKHHPWSLDEAQIEQYHLGGTLHPRIRWTEAMDVPRRVVQFIELGEHATLASLVCEDLAQIDDVAEVIRSVGPTAVITLLLDGPQLTSRWAARYASVLADDPGSAVMTLTSFGMAQRSRPQGRSPSPVIALWKDPVRGAREIALEAGAQGVILTVCGDRVARGSADGRCPADNAIDWFDVAVHQVRASTAGLEHPAHPLGTQTSRVLETEDLTVLTGWAQAVAEGLAYAPEHAPALLAEAKAGAAWRRALGLAEPSAQLCKSIDCIDRIVRTATSPGSPPTFDAALAALGEDPPGEMRLDRLARRVLRSTLEQSLARRAMEASENEPP